MDESELRGRRNDWRRPGPSQPEMRVSDAERHEIGDLLSKHFADGRLDDVEFNERLDKAMSAKTRADLAGLLDDLPRLDQSSAPPLSPRAGDHRAFLRIALVGLVVICVANFSWYQVHPRFPWVLVFVLAIVLSSRRRTRWGRFGRSAES